MGNISGVAVAISAGGPGAVFWMWMSAFLGMSTKFFTGTLAVMFRKRDSEGRILGGPMYIITEGLGQRWKPFSVFFAAACMLAVFPVFQSNQLTQVVRDIVLVPTGMATGFTSDLISGLVLAFLMGIVIFGGITRIGKVAATLVPLMVLLYLVLVVIILFHYPERIIPVFKLIVSDAFSAQAVLGGAIGTIIVTGVKRAAFSNEAGVGTAPLAHSEAKTNEPVREGLVAMLGPAIDTLVVCTLTALVILITGVWENSSADGITLTALAFEQAIPTYGPYLLIVCVFFFALSTLFTLPFYGSKCFAYLAGHRYVNYYMIASMLSVVVAAVSSMHVVVGFIDSVFALMAFPNMVAAILLAPKVKAASEVYFKKIRNKG
jgi:AGCS family alanine or glycine:cation symporter